MSTETLRTPALVEDIFVKVLCSCDIATVLTCSLASRTLHSLSTSKHVWLALISDLLRRGFIDLFPEQRLEDLSTHELLDLAKRTIHGPKTWSTLDDRPPLVAREIILKPNIRTGHGILTWENEPQLLPGGQFILFQHRGDFECRSTADDRLIWQYKPSWSVADVQEYSAEMVDDGQSVVILLGIRTYGTTRKNYLEVVKLDLQTGSSTSLLTKTAPDTHYDNPYYRLKLLGDFAIVSLTSHSGLITLQISTSAWSILEVSLEYFEIALVPEHIVLLRHGSTPQSLNLGIWRGDALVGCGAAEAPSSIDIIDPVTSITIDTAIPQLEFRLESHLSPLSDDSSTIWAVVSSSSRSASLIYKYHVSHPQAQALAIALISSWGLPHSVQFRAPDEFSITLAGFADIFEQQTEKIMSLRGGSKPVNHPEGERPHLSGYSGAMTYATPEKVVVNYYV
ncbi:hypothetical protein FPV67DRAFT_1783287 [Lyophyllum atratum]|nr:hypothetical protein FPV67DRAFT_1783287 [Lyophyllum atratum]